MSRIKSDICYVLGWLPEISPHTGYFNSFLQQSRPLTNRPKTSSPSMPFDHQQRFYCFFANSSNEFFLACSLIFFLSSSCTSFEALPSNNLSPEQLKTHSLLLIIDQQKLLTVFSLFLYTHQNEWWIRWGGPEFLFIVFACFPIYFLMDLNNKKKGGISPKISTIHGATTTFNYMVLPKFGAPMTLYLFQEKFGSTKNKR